MVSKWQVIIHFLHRLGAIIISAVLCFFIYKFGKHVNKNRWESKILILISIILIIQIILGAATVLSERMPFIASFHVVNGAALLGCCMVFILFTQSNKLKDLNF